MSGQFSQLGKTRALNAVTGLSTVTSYSGFMALDVAGTSTITNYALTSNVATITTAAAHGYSTGQAVVIAGLSGTGTPLNSATGVPWIITGTTSTTFTFALTNANITSAAGSGTASITPTDSILGFEYAATGYARQSVTWSTPTVANPPVAGNTALLTFGPFTAGTGGTLTYAELHMSSSGGSSTTDVTAWWTLTLAKTPANGDSATVAVQGLTLSFAFPVG